MKTELFRSSLRDGFKEQYRRIESMCSNLSTDQLAFQPDEKSWSAGQCLYHIWMTNDMYLLKVSLTIRTSQHNEPEGQEYESNWMGRKFHSMIGPTGGENTPVPKQLEPDADHVPEDIVQMCLDQMVGFDEFLNECSETDLMKTKMTSPISSLVRLQLGDVFKAMQLHNERHLNQVGRILRLSGASHSSMAGTATLKS